MADTQSNIKVSIDTTDALASIKNLQRQISVFHTSMAKSGAAANAVTSQMQQSLINSINATGKFSAQMKTIKTTTESFTSSLEKNKFSLGEYFRYAGGASKSFGKLFKTEFDTINKVARENVKDLQTQYIKMGRDANGAMKAIAVRPLSLDMNDLATKTMIASEKQALLNQLLKQGSTNLLNFGKNTQWAGRQLMVGFTIPLLTVGSQAAKTFMDMETQAIRFKKVYGDLFTPQAESAQALDDIKNLGKEFTKYGVAVADTVGLAADAAAAGFQGIDLQRQTTAATRLSILGQIDNQKALETTISLQNAFGTSSDALAGSIDFLNAVENQTVVSLDDITTAIPKVAPVIKQLGGDVKDLAFFLTAMKEGGINASEGANALKSGLASMINPTSKATAMLGSFGINIKKIVVDNKGDLKKTVVDFATALNQLDPLNRAQAIEQMFGKFQFARLSTLFANVTKDGTQAARVLDLAGSSVQDLASLSDKELGITADSAMNKFKKSVEDLKLALVPVGEEFLKAVTPIASFASNLLEKFNGLGSGTKKFLIITATAVAGLGPILLMTFGLLANGLANIIKGFTAVKTLFNKTGQSTRTLGTEVNYMTAEQRNAAAVAASLDQVHTKLAQTFTAEAAAVDALAGAYGRAILKQAQFSGPIIPRAGKTKKFAEGKPYVVGGTGNKDSELSLLMPGETVIPTARSKKYGSLINGIIADNIPGYADGKSLSDLKKENKLYAAPKVVAEQTSTLTWNTLADELAAVDKAAEEFNSTLQDGNKLTDEQIKNMKRVTAAHKEADTVDVPVGPGQNMSVKSWKASNLMPEIGPNTFLNSLVSKKEGLSAFEDNGMAQAAEKLGLSMSEVSAELESLKKGIQPVTKRGASVLQEVAGFYKTEVPSYTATGKRKKETPSARGVRFQAAATEAVLKTRLADTGPKQYYDTMTTGAYDASKDAKAAQQVYAKARKVRMTFLKETEEMADKAMLAVKKKLGIKSPSTEFIKVGEQVAEGMAIGIKNGNDEVVAASNKLGTSAVKATDAAVKKNRRVSTRPQGPANIGPEMPSGATQLNIVPQLTSAEKRKIKRQQMQTKLLGKTKAVGSKLGTRLGGGTALLGANMALSAMPNFAGKDLVQSTMTGANMGMMFGPWGAAAGGAIGLVTTAIGKLNAKEKEHAAIAKVAFQTSSNEVSIFGGKILDATLKLNNVGIAIDGVSTKFGGLNPQVQQFVDMINNLKEDDPLKMFVEGLKDQKFTALVGNIRTKITSGIATGAIEAKDAQKYVMGYLAAAGRASEFSNVWKSISSSVADSTAATTKSFDKLYQSIFPDIVVGQMGLAGSASKMYTSINGTLSKYKDLTPSLQRASDQMLNFAGVMSNGSLNIKEFTARMAGFKGTALNSKIGVDALGVAIKNTGNADSIAAFERIRASLNTIGGEANTAANAILLMTINSMNATKEVDAWGKANAGRLGLNPMDLAQTSGSNEKVFQDWWNKVGKKRYTSWQKEQAAAIAAVTGTTDAYKDTTTGTDQLSSAATKYLKILDSEINALKKKRDAQKNANDETQRQIDLEQKQQDLSNQATQAKISGNYIQAAMLGQQSINVQAEFNKETELRKKDAEIAALEARAAEIKDGAKLTKAETGKLSGKANGGLIKKYASGGLIVGPGTGTSDSITASLGYAGGGSIRVSNGEFIMKEAAVKSYGVSNMNAINNGTANVGANGGGTVYNINMPITSNNSSASGVADEVMRRLKVELNKTNKTNKVWI